MEASESASQPKDMDWQEARKEREEYMKKLRNWLDEARLWYSVSAGFPNTLYGVPFPVGAPHNQNPYTSFYQRQPFGPNRGYTQQTGANQATINGVPFYQTYPFISPPNLLRLPTNYEFKVPPLWKRFCAEFIDFCILFSVKMGITFWFMESFSIGKALDLYGLDVLQKGVLDNPEFPLTYEFLLLEFLHRFIVCAYETYFIQGKTCATPGKRCMGLMVVNVESLIAVPNQRMEAVSATGVKAPGWQRALIRSAVKNIIVGFLLPLCFTFYVFPFNRTSYDMMANTLVVEAHPEFLLYQSLIIR